MMVFLEHTGEKNDLYDSFVIFKNMPRSLKFPNQARLL